MVQTLYNPTIGSNIMSITFALNFLGDEPLAPMDKTFRSPSIPFIEGHEILRCANKTKRCRGYPGFSCIQILQILYSHRPSHRKPSYRCAANRYHQHQTRDKCVSIPILRS